MWVIKSLWAELPRKGVWSGKNMEVRLWAGIRERGVRHWPQVKSVKEAPKDSIIKVNNTKIIQNI